MIERLKTVLLTVLVALSVLQYALLFATGQEPVYLLLPAGEATFQDSYLPVADNPPELLATPLRLIAHLPNLGKHALLRSNSAFFPNLWTMAKGVLLAAPSLDSAAITPVPWEEWATSLPSMELILCQPLPLSAYLQLLGVELIGSRDYQVDRFYLSAYVDDCILFSDGTSCYSLPRRLNAQVLRVFLAMVEGGVHVEVYPFDLTPYGLYSPHGIYSLGAVNASQWLIAPLLTKELYEEQGPKAFGNPSAMRILRDASGETIYEDNQRRLWRQEYQLLLEQMRVTPSSEESPAPIWLQVAGFLRSIDLWPELNLYCDGIYGTDSRQIIFMQQAQEGRPIFYREEGSAGGGLVSTLRGRSRNGELIALRYRPMRFLNKSSNMPALPLEQLLGTFTAQLSLLPGTDKALPPLRDVYEGFLCQSDSAVTDLVWVLEFYDGRRYFCDMVTGAYLGYQPPLAERH